MKKNKKEAILNAATKLFSTKGFKETHMSEISKMTGAAEGTIVYHFKNKENLFLTILTEFQENIVAEFARYNKEKKFENGLAMLEDIIAFYLRLANSMEDRFLLLHRHEAYVLAHVNTAFRPHLEAIYTCFVDIFERAISLGKKDGSIKAVPERKMAMIIFGMVDSVLRFNAYGLYNAGTLFNELILASRRILTTG
jgi:AcrR family transcriptional regulator